MSIIRRLLTMLRGGRTTTRTRAPRARRTTTSRGSMLSRIMGAVRGFMRSGGSRRRVRM